MTTNVEQNRGAGTLDESPSGASQSTQLPKADESPAPLRGRGGGPRTPEGKRRSSGNATKHGVFSKSPVIGDEREEDWLDHLEGMRASHGPHGRNEDILVEQLALNLWQRLREERWVTETLRLQFERIDHRNRGSIYPRLRGLPEDEAAWRLLEASDAKVAAELLRGQDPDAIVPLHALTPYLTAFERVTETTLPRSSFPEFDDSPFPDLGPVTVREVLEGIALAAKATGRPKFRIVIAIEEEIGMASLHQVLRRNDDRRDKEIMRTESLILTDAAFAGHERRVNLLDKEYDRLLRRLEVAQRARGGALPPPLRIHVTDE